MAKAAARLALIKKAGTAIAGVKSLSFKRTASGIDVTDQNSNGIITYLSNAMASSQLSFSVSGVHEDPTLRNLAFDSADPNSVFMTDVSFHFANAVSARDTLTGNFLMTNYEESGADDAAVEFSADFVSSGPWTLA